MSRSAMPSLSVEATAPEALSLLDQRLLLAEEQTEALIQDMGSLGVSRDQILGSAERMDATQRPVSPLKIRHVLGDVGMLWQQCDSLVSRVCRMESLLQTLKLTVFRLEIERELDPSHTVRLKQQLAALQQESEEEQQASRREVMKLRDQLHQAYQERDEACTEVQQMGMTLGAATAAKMDVALAAEELKIVKSEMSQKLMEMKEQMRQESACSHEAMKSDGELLQRVKEMERVVEMERRQALLLQSDCQALHVEVQTSRQRLEEEKDRSRQLKQQTEIKDSLVFELKTELKRQQRENSKLLKEGRELRAAAERVQTLNTQLQSQCSQLSSALRSLTVKNAQQQSEHQANLKAERSRTVKQLQEQDLLLEAARHNIQAELQVVLTDKASLQMELEKLKGEHAQLQQSSSIAQETAVTQRELLERTIERLRGEVCTAKKEEDAMRKHLEGSKAELCLIVTKLEGERSTLETQLSEAKLEVGSLSSALQSQQDENRRLMGKVTALEQQQRELAGGASEETLLRIFSGPHNAEANPEAGNFFWRMRHGGTREVLLIHPWYALGEQFPKDWMGAIFSPHALQQVDQTLKYRTDNKNKLAFDKGKLKISELEALQNFCDPAGKVVSQTLENILASHTRFQLNSQTQQQELGGREQELDTLKKNRLQVQREIRKHQTEVEKLQQLLTSSHSKNNGALESLQKALDTATVDNKRLAKSLEQAVLTNSSLHSKLEQARDWYQGTITLRDEELREARSKIHHLSEELATIKHQTREDYKSSMRTLQREISELKMTVKDSASGSGDLSKANRELRRRMCELEQLVSKQKACIKEQRSQLRQQQDSGNLQDNSQKVESLEESTRDLPEKESTDRTLQDVRVDYQQVLSKQDTELERWTSTIQRWEAKRELAHVVGGPSL
ncbi:coiled-coil domain-containing protein 150 [Thunnus albacares]|uniref:coiled-coil domain-containing protein 150 n=1 Tax=Thunnus albacares TaxID=8236 RepID=UPI001CF61EE8|nr:coiled-coil domain-containing protein 150 [Thunnus albacares]